jgi:hypothetical protein
VPISASGFGRPGATEVNSRRRTKSEHWRRNGRIGAAIGALAPQSEQRRRTSWVAGPNLDLRTMLRPSSRSCPDRAAGSPGA